MKDICYEINPNIGSSAGSREKQCQNRTIDSHLG